MCYFITPYVYISSAVNETDLMTNYNSIADKTQIVDCLLLLIDCLLLLLVILLTNLKYSCSVTVFICVSMCIIYMSPLILYIIMLYCQYYIQNGNSLADQLKLSCKD